jgi:hypothetical protein
MRTTVVYAMGHIHLVYTMIFIQVAVVSPPLVYDPISFLPAALSLISFLSNHLPGGDQYGDPGTPNSIRTLQSKHKTDQCRPRDGASYHQPSMPQDTHLPFSGTHISPNRSLIIAVRPGRCCTEVTAAVHPLRTLSKSLNARYCGGAGSTSRRKCQHSSARGGVCSKPSRERVGRLPLISLVTPSLAALRRTQVPWNPCYRRPFPTKLIVFEIWIHRCNVFK